EVARWAATMETDEDSIPAVRYGEGPWGAFVAVEVAAGEELRASLLAPREGRAAPSRAERELLSLLGQNAAIAVEHALLVEQLRVAGIPHLAVADPDRFEQVLWALLDNAVKYSPAGSAVAVRLFGDRAASRELQSVIQIRDEGSGMDEEAQARAFEQFYRSETARRLAPDGSGVGLYAARGVVEAMGGTIEIASRLGGGTTVTLTLPAEPLEEEVARSDRVTKVQA